MIIMEIEVLVFKVRGKIVCWGSEKSQNFVGGLREGGRSLGSLLREMGKEED